MSGFPCLNMKLRRAITAKICQDACACTFHILAETLFVSMDSLSLTFFFLQASTLFIKNISAFFFPF